MSEMWNRTLVYLGLREEPEEMYDDVPERFDPEDDPHAEHAPQRPGTSSPRPLVGATTRPRADARSARGEGEGRSQTETGRPTRDPAVTETDRSSSSDSNVRALRAGEKRVRAANGGSSISARVGLVDVDTFEDVEAVGSRFRTGQPVLFEVVSEDRTTGRRVIDFVSGLTYASRGRLTKVGRRAFLLVPDGVEVSEEEQQRLLGLGYRLPVSRNA